MPQPRKALGQTIADLRVKAGISQERLADLARIHRTYVSQLERGLKSPTLDVLLRVALALNIRASQLVRLAEEGSK